MAASDASKYGIESEKVISHLARFLITTGRNCCHVEKGSLQIIFAVNKFHKMIFGRHHKPLLAVFRLKKGIRVHTASWLQRWATKFMGYDFKIKYQSTTAFGQACALSRLIRFQMKTVDATLVSAIESEIKVRQVLSDAVGWLLVTLELIKEATANDKALREMVKPSFSRTFYLF